MDRIEIVVRGRVQGVAFRAYARSQALRLGLTGWVRNRPDGSVRIVAEGDRPALEALADWAARGPDHARVDACQVSWSDGTGAFTGFEITG